MVIALLASVGYAVDNAPTAYASTPMAAFTDLSNALQSGLTSGKVGQDYPQAWVARSYSEDGSYLTVGGDGLLFYNGAFSAPSSQKPGFLTGAAWDGNEFLVVGQHYAPHDGVLMQTYTPATNTLNDITSLFPSQLAINASLYETVWNSSSFLIFGSERLNTNYPKNLLYAYDPITKRLDNVSAILRGVPALVLSVQMVSTPQGIFVLGSTGFGYSRFELWRIFRGTLTDLTSLEPVEFGGANSQFQRPSTMVWANGILYVAGQQDGLGGGVFDVFSYNPSTGAVVDYHQTVNRFSGQAATMSYVFGYLLVGGVSSCCGGPSARPLLMLFTPGTAGFAGSTPIAQNMTDLIPSSYYTVESISSQNDTAFIAAGPFGRQVYGELRFGASQTTTSSTITLPTTSSTTVTGSTSGSNNIPTVTLYPPSLNGLTVLMMTTTNCRGCTIFWIWGDGAWGPGSLTQTHTYLRSGQYFVGAGATDANGNTGPLTYEQVSVGSQAYVATTGSGGPPFTFDYNFVIVLVGSLATLLSLFVGWRIYQFDKQKTLPHFETEKVLHDKNNQIDIVVRNQGPGKAAHVLIRIEGADMSRPIMREEPTFGEDRETRFTLTVNPQRQNTWQITVEYATPDNENRRTKTFNVKHP